MPNYEELYFKMFNAVTDVIANLIKIQQNAEEDYLKSCEKNDFKLLKSTINN